MTTFVLILGAQKTGTSTAVAICSADPASHVFYEVDFTAPPAFGRNQEFIAAFPGLADLFESDLSLKAALGEALRRVPEWNASATRVFGTKIPGLRPDKIAANRDLPLVLTVRDIRTWLCKNTVVRHYLQDDIDANAVPTAIAYAQFLLESFRHDRCLRLRLTDITRDGAAYWPQRMSDFLGLPMSEIKRWWEKKSEIGAKTRYSNWTQLHRSTFAAPVMLDTTSTLTGHPFWSALLPIFDKYFQAHEGRFAAAEVEADLRELARLGERMTMSLREGFATVKSAMIRDVSVNADGRIEINMVSGFELADDA
jgi:hypothetical protein